MGFDRPATIADKAYGGTVALPLWVGAMQCALKRGYAMGNIRTQPISGRKVGLRLCRDSGNLAHSGCEAKRTAYTETIADVSIERTLCTHHCPHEVFADDEYAEAVETPEGITPDGFAEEPEYAPLFTDGQDAEL